MSKQNLLADKVAYSQNDKELLRNVYRKINELVYIINTKDTGIYNNEEIFTAQQWYLEKNVGEQQIIFRKVFENIALPNAGTTSVAHGLNLDANWDFIKIYGTAKDPATPAWISLATLTTIDIDTTNINITSTIDLSAYTNGRIVIEYTKP